MAKQNGIVTARNAANWPCLINQRSAISLARTATQWKAASTNKEMTKAPAPKAARVRGPAKQTMPISPGAKKRSATDLKIYKSVWTRLGPAQDRKSTRLNSSHSQI